MPNQLPTNTDDSSVNEFSVMGFNNNGNIWVMNVTRCPVCTTCTPSANEYVGDVSRRKEKFTTGRHYNNPVYPTVVVASVWFPR